MNNMPYPFMPPIIYPQINYDEELKKIRYEIEEIKKRIDQLENKHTKNYLKKEDGMYIM